MKYYLIVFSFLFSLSVSAQKIFQIHFNPKMEVSGQKFSLRDINPQLPADWDGYHYVILEYKCTTAQRFQIGFTTAGGYNELRVMSYVPNAWNRLAIPLKYFTELPDPALDLAATFNHARYTGWVNLGGRRGPLHHVDSVGIRMRKPIGNPSFYIRSLTLSVDDPGDLYLGSVPAVDEFGQSNLVEWPGKSHSLAALQRCWQTEDALSSSSQPYNYSKYGGYKQKRLKATDFFRTQKVAGRWWLVDPEGYLFLSVGVDCIGIGGGLNVRDYNLRSNMYKVLPPDSLMLRLGSSDRQGHVVSSFGLWNIYRRYGDNCKAKALQNVIRRMDRWGINTIANWSSREVISLNRKAFVLPLGGLGLSNELMGLCDIYSPDYLSNMEQALRQQVSPLRNNPWLIGYFIGNEPAWLNQEDRLCSVILNGPERPIKIKLTEYLSKHGDSPAMRKNFVWTTFESFLSTANSLLKKYDPNHLNLGIRFGDPLNLDKAILRICGETFDVFSFNCYDKKPNPAMMDCVRQTIDLPVMIGEYHFGTVDRGMAQSLWQVDSQYQRGVAYCYYTEQAYSHPSLVGTAYFQWSDQDLTGRRDGENYNCGLVDVTDQPYAEQVEAMMHTARLLYAIHSGIKLPTAIAPNNCRGHEPIPDLWNK